MGTKIIPCNPTHGDGHASFYEGNHRDYDLPYFSVKLHPSVVQCRTTTSWGMWYFSLNNSIKAEIFTRRSNLPIFSLRSVEWLAEEVSREDRGSSKSETYVG